MSKCIDLTDKTFGFLKVIRKSENRNKNRNVQWVCECRCGNIVTVEGCNLRNGHTQSCGCYQANKASSLNKKMNVFEVRDNYVVGYTTNTNREFYFDADDYDVVKEHSWFENDSGYILTRLKNGKCIRLHRFIMNLDDSSEPILDHRNRLKYDNRKENLRFSNKQLNSINRGCNKNNKLGCKGICRLKNGKYYARIMKDGKDVYLGTFTSLQDAKQARIKKEVELFDEHAYTE